MIDLLSSLSPFIGPFLPWSFFLGALCGSVALFILLRCLSERESIFTEQTPEAVFSSMAEGVIAINNNREIWLVNPAARAMLGLKKDLTGRNLEQSDLPAMLIGAMDAALGSDSSVECEFTSGGSKAIALQIKASRISDQRGTSTGAVVVFTDITRLRRLERVRKDFVANVSHELRTPITAIRGFVETLLGGMQSSDEKEHFLTIVQRHAERLQSIVEDLLILSKLEEESEREELETEEADLSALAEMVIRSMQPQAKKKGVAVSLKSSGPINSKVNRRLIEQALMNLLDNALKYSPDNSFVRVEVDAVGEDIVLAVRDAGPGIAKEHQARIFERFYRIDKARDRKVGGTGLGLAIVKHVALIHGGNISVESTPGRGSVFTITVPKNSAATDQIEYHQVA